MTENLSEVFNKLQDIMREEFLVKKRKDSLEKTISEMHSILFKLLAFNSLYILHPTVREDFFSELFPQMCENLELAFKGTLKVMRSLEDEKCTKN